MTGRRHCLVWTKAIAIKSGLEDLKLVREGKLKPMSLDELIEELENGKAEVRE